MDQALLNLVLALATTELLHNFIETKSAREKIKRLNAYMDKKPYTEMKVNIDTRTKAYATSMVGIIVPTLILWGIYNLINVSGNNALWLLVALLVLSYFVLAVLMDKYHVEIEKITKKFKK